VTKRIHEIIQSLVIWSLMCPKWTV